MKKVLILILIISLFVTCNVKAISLKEASSLIPVLEPAVNTGNDNEATDTATGGGSAGCGEVITGDFKAWLTNAFSFMRNVGVAVCVLLTVVDFVSVIIGAKEDDLKNAFNRSVKRLIAAILLILTPVLVNFIIDIVNSTSGVDLENCM